MPTINQMRVDLSKVYPYSLSKKWKDKCLHVFPENKVQAMWFNFKAQGRFEKAKELEKKHLAKDGVQLRMDI